MAFQLLLVISGVESPTQATEDSEILRRVLMQVVDAWYEKPRRILLFFYYPSDEYVSYLMNVDQRGFLDEIDCRDLFGGKDPRERILIFELEDAYQIL